MSTRNPSTTITDASSSTSAPTTTSSQSNSNTATLYLSSLSAPIIMDSTSFTFLATILILVLLSASLVLRSYILRRRYRQRFQQALADGLFVDLDRSAFGGTGQFDTLGGFRRSARRLGPKPVLWDTWMHPADKDHTWSSITPIAVHCTPSSPSTLISSPQSPTGSPSSPQAQPRPSFFSQLRLPSPFSLSTPPSSPLPRQLHTPIGSPTAASIRSSPAAPGSPDPSTRTEKDGATLAICVLVAMPDVSAPMHRPVPNTKGKGVDPLESQARRQSSDAADADPLLPLSLHRSGPRIPDFVVEEEELPLVEFGVVEMRTGEWVWTA